MIQQEVKPVKLIWDWKMSLYKVQLVKFMSKKKKVDDWKEILNYKIISNVFYIFSWSYANQKYQNILQW